MSRIEKIEHAIQRHMAIILYEELKDPRLGFVTITRVEATQDLRQAKIFYSVLGQEQDYASTKEALESASGFLRKILAERINLRFAPELIFREDHSAEYSVRIQQVIDEIRGHDEPGKRSKRNKKT